MKSTKEKDFIPYGRQEVTESDIKAVVDVLKSEYLTQGPIVPEFEKAISSKVLSKFGIAVNSATSALHLACRALSLGENDWLWTSPISFVASANCGIYCGAKIDFVDVDLKTGLISIELLKIKLSLAKKEGKLPKILVVVHLAGTSCDMEEINKLSVKYGFYIVEDASHALGGKYNNKYVGNCEYSTICIFSFHPVKIITTGEGGFLTTNNKLIAEKLYDLRSHGIIKDNKRFINKSNSPWEYEQQDIGYNYKMTDIHAALGLNQLKRLDLIVKKRNIILKNYNEMTKHLPIYFLSVPKNVISSVHLVIMNLQNNDKNTHLNLFKYLRKNKIGVQVHYTPIHLHPFYRKLGFKIGDFPNSEIYANRAISLPVFPNLNINSQHRIIDLLTEFFHNNLN